MDWVGIGWMDGSPGGRGYRAPYVAKKEFQLHLRTLSPVAFPSGSDGTPVEANLWNLKASLTNQPDKDGGLGMPRLLCPSES